MMSGSSMTSTEQYSSERPPPRNSRREELFAFLVLAVLIWPLLTVAVVGGYGFIIWMSQLVLGPPGPPH